MTPTPDRARAVGQHADERIDHRIENERNRKREADEIRGDTEDLVVVDEKEIRDAVADNAERRTAETKEPNRRTRDHAAASAHRHSDDEHESVYGASTQHQPLQH